MSITNNQAKPLSSEMMIQQKFVQLWSKMPQVFKIDPKVYVWKRHISVDFDYTVFGWAKYNGIVIPIALQTKFVDDGVSYWSYFKSLFYRTGQVAHDCHEFARQWHISDEQLDQYLMGGGTDVKTQWIRNLSGNLSYIDNLELPDYHFEGLVLRHDFKDLKLTDQQLKTIYAQSQKLSWPKVPHK